NTILLVYDVVVKIIVSDDDERDNRAKDTMRRQVPTLSPGEVLSWSAENSTFRRHHPVALLDQLRDQLPVHLAVRPQADPLAASVRRRKKTRIAGEDAGVERVDARGNCRTAARRLERGKTLFADVENGMAVAQLLFCVG